MMSCCFFICFKNLDFTTFSLQMTVSWVKWAYFMSGLKIHLSLSLWGKKHVFCFRESVKGSCHEEAIPDVEEEKGNPLSKFWSFNSWGGEMEAVSIFISPQKSPPRQYFYFLFNSQSPNFQQPLRKAPPWYCQLELFGGVSSKMQKFLSLQNKNGKKQLQFTVFLMVESIRRKPRVLYKCCLTNLTTSFQGNSK